jgi:hypothetical protein
MFRKLDLFPSSGEGGEKTPTQLGSLKRANFNHWTTSVKFEVTLRLTVSQSVTLGVEPHFGLMTRYLIPFDSYGPFLWGALSDKRTVRFTQLFNHLRPD